MSADILAEMTVVFRQVFDDPGLVISPETTANDVPGWDSFSHVNLMITVEHHFKIKFTDKEIASFKNVGELVASIMKKSGAAA
jgi:acyl carrier protein